MTDIIKDWKLTRSGTPSIRLTNALTYVRELTEQELDTLLEFLFMDGENAANSDQRGVDIADTFDYDEDIEDNERLADDDIPF